MDIQHLASQSARSYLATVMSKCCFRRVSIASLFVLLLRLVPLGHAEFLGTDLNTPHRLQSHGCTTKEIHRGLTESHQCSLCQRHHLQEAYLAPAAFTHSAPVQDVQFFSVRDPHEPGFFAAAPKRAPPVF